MDYFCHCTEIAGFSYDEVICFANDVSQNCEVVSVSTTRPNCVLLRNGFVWGVRCELLKLKGVTKSKVCERVKETICHFFDCVPTVPLELWPM